VRLRRGAAGGDPAGDDAAARRGDGRRAGAISVELRCEAADPCEQRTLDQLARVVKPDDPAQACTLQYGGPERAHLTGTLEGKRVDVTVGRANGCEIADYEALFEALGRKPPTAR
jgi:hypothetical protein